jgi:hypothetical protein
MEAGGLRVLSVTELKQFDRVHALPAETFPGPPELGASVRAFRMLMMHALARVADGACAPLERAWRELERYFGRDASFRRGYFVPSWLLLGLPAQPGGRAAAHAFEKFGRGCGRSDLADLVTALRETRLGICQEV